jgi:hypothetical protein
VTHVPGDHQVFVSLHHPNHDPAAVARDDRSMSVVALRVQVEAEELETVADAFKEFRS